MTRRCLIVATIVVLAWPVAAARARNAGIVATFNARSGQLNRDEAAIRKATRAYRRNGRARPVIRALRHEVRDIRALIRAIKPQRASSGRGRRGKRAITRGLSLIARAYSSLANEIQQAHSGHPVSQSALNATKRTDDRGRAKLIAGLRLLGVRVRG